ncbi:hypothetical protein CAEBREN_22813 [Caenorhabditis brenneri]|uniref:BZIP domain-containing protein n=2 Tax=Caenorhabditis brenneri TaxID=135651 RepID=G0NZU6_CAEBE|nr:hypothetical protein CAEBREN_22813 [Caenorhabditis brenneri]
MIGNKTFSSEEEQLLTLLDETQGHFPLLKSEDPVIFYNSAYERDLFMEYNLDFGGESPSSSLQHQMKDEEPMFVPDETKLEPAWLLSPSESEDQAASPSPYLHKSKPMKMPTIKRSQASSFNPYSSGPLIKSPSSKRGRPVKVTSDTKMANYARNYREQKKNQMSMLQMRNEELEAELRLFREEKEKMKTALSNAHAEITHLKKVLDSDSQIARVVANMGAQSTTQLPAGRAGVCVHVGALGTTVEVCKQCADNNQMRMDAKFTESFVQDFGNGTELFDGDFSAFDNYLNC